MTMMTKECVKSSGNSKTDLDAEAKALKNVLNTHETTELKLECLIRKYVELAHQNKMMQGKHDDVKKKHDQIVDERDHLQASYNRANLAKSKLESLCRELQRHVKCLKEEYDQRNKEEDKKRQEIAAKFQTTINDINVKMQDNQKSNQTLREDNMELASKLKSLLEEYRTREEHIEKILKQKSLEIQLWETKLAQQAMQGAEDKQKDLTEKRNLLEEYVKEKKKNELLVEQEQELRNQLSLYTEKFEEFQKTLTRSNDVFATFKQEMNKMSKTIKKLEKENLSWKGKHEQVSKSMFTMAEELRNSKNKNETLERLCRALQVENQVCRKHIRKCNDITKHHVPEGEEEPEIDAEPEKDGEKEKEEDRKEEVDQKEDQEEQKEEAPELPVIDDKEDAKENHDEDKIESEECQSVAKEDVEIEVETSAKVEVVVEQDKENEQ
ncbi:alpha-taxilin-like [Bolinopsis microptera]|uniref:alpha-taxilin-like n=1 Tax=Bolinopsis microptera TaxID=2820187 RepID=UPI003079A3D4